VVFHFIYFADIVAALIISEQKKNKKMEFGKENNL